MRNAEPLKMDVKIQNFQQSLVEKNVNLYVKIMDATVQMIARMEGEVTETPTAFAISMKVIEGSANSAVAFLMGTKIILPQLNREGLNIT